MLDFVDPVHFTLIESVQPYRPWLASEGWATRAILEQRQAPTDPRRRYELDGSAQITVQ